MSTVTWVSNSSGNWMTAADWSGGAVPGASDDVFVDTQSPITITYNTGTQDVLSLTMLDGTFQLKTGSLRVLGDTDLVGGLDETSKGATLTFGGVVSQVAGTFIQGAGNVVIDSGYLTLGGNGNTLGGTFSGSDLEFVGGSDSLLTGFKLSTESALVYDASVTLQTNVVYAGSFTQSLLSTVYLGGHSIKLTGSYTTPNTAPGESANVVGPGTLLITQGAAIGSMNVVGAVTLELAGHTTVNGEVEFAATSAGTPALTNEKSGAITLSGTIFSANNVTLENFGTLVMQGGTDDAATINSGNIQIGSGAATFEGPLSGGGAVDMVDGSRLALESSVASDVTISFAPHAEVLLNNLFSGSIANFASSGDVVVESSLGYFASTSLAFNSATDSLLLSNGSGQSYTIDLTGGHSASDFYLFSFNGLAAVGHL